MENYEETPDTFEPVFELEEETPVTEEVVEEEEVVVEEAPAPKKKVAPKTRVTIGRETVVVEDLTDRDIKKLAGKYGARKLRALGITK
jgi:hypothetical protein